MFSSVKTTLFTAFGTFRRLAICDHDTRLRRSSFFFSHRFADSGVELFPHSIFMEQSKVVIDRLPSRKIMRQRSPDTAILDRIKHGVQNPSPAMLAWRTGRTWFGQVWRNLRPFGIIQIGRVFLL